MDIKNVMRSTKKSVIRNKERKKKHVKQVGRKWEESKKKDKKIGK